MKYKALRHYIKTKKLEKPHTIKDCQLVIDGQSFFKDSYKNIKREFVLGADCDVYAAYLKSKLICFLQCNVKCYVIFKGASMSDFETTQDKHQQVIDKLSNVQYKLTKPPYLEPLFVNDVQKQVLKEMDIKYFCCEYDSIQAIVGVARTFQCPVLTDNVEYSLFGVSCILPGTVTLEVNNKLLNCTIYEQDDCKKLFSVFNKMPVLLTLASDGANIDIEAENLLLGKGNAISSTIRQIKRNRKYPDEYFFKTINDEDKRKSVLELYESVKVLYYYPSCHLAVKYFQREKAYKMFSDNKKWFIKGVACGRIALPHVNMKRKNFIIGSRLMNDTDKPDAMLAASQIIAFSYKMLMKSENLTLNFIGRKYRSCSVWDMNTDFDADVCRRNIFASNDKVRPIDENPFEIFLTKVLPNPGYFLYAPKSCRVLMITLTYYICNVNKDFVDCAHCILLSYLLLGPISKAIHEYNKSPETVTDVQKYKDCKKMHDGLNFLFRKVNMKNHFDINLIHVLSEFQHCLQHMNYLNKLCTDEVLDDIIIIPSTVYHNTYNATFVYNAILFKKHKDTLMTYLRENFDGLWPFKIYQKLVIVLEKCMDSSPQSVKGIRNVCSEKFLCELKRNAARMAKPSGI